MLIQFTLSQNIDVVVICLLKHVHHIFIFFFLLNLKFLHIMSEIYIDKIKPRQNLSKENKFLQRFISIR